MLTPRPKTYEAYWHFAAKRQEVFFNRLQGMAPPWSDDDILNEYKFCNAYRASDRVSQFLIKDVIYSGSYSEEDTLFRILLFKIFNKIETWLYLEEKLGTITLQNFRFQQFASLLDELMLQGQAIYTSAYMSCASKAFGFDKKHYNHLMLISQMFQKDKFAQHVCCAKKMEEVYTLLIQYPLIGKFMAYQLATDINYSAVTDFDENSFTIAGPGAERGIQKCFTNTDGKSNDYIIRWMQEHQEQEFARLEIQFKSLWGRPLQLIDCQNLFCETDKYARVAFPEIKSNRKRIKNRYQVSSRGAVEYFYPPKWGINEKIQASNVQRSNAVQKTAQLAYAQLQLTF